MHLTREEKGHHVKGKGMECVCSHDYQPDLSFLDLLISQTSKITYTHTHTHTHTHCQLNCQLYTCACVLSHFSCVRLCDPMDCSLLTRLLCPRNSPSKNTGVCCHALLRGSSQPRDQTRISGIGRWVLYHSHHLGSPHQLPIFPNKYNLRP